MIVIVVIVRVVVVIVVIVIVVVIKVFVVIVVVIIVVRPLVGQGLPDSEFMGSLLIIAAAYNISTLSNITPDRIKSVTSQSLYYVIYFRS